MKYHETYRSIFVQVAFQQVNTQQEMDFSRFFDAFP